MDFAFFAVNFGYSKSDYLELTEVDKLFIRKAWETKAVQDTELIRNAVLNAVANALRKKSKGFIRLWRRNGHADVAEAAEQLRTIKEIEMREHGWIDMIYSANGRRRPHGS